MSEPDWAARVAELEALLRNAERGLSLAKDEILKLERMSRVVTHKQRDSLLDDRDRLAARVAELERLWNGEMEMREHIENDRDHLRRALGFWEAQSRTRGYPTAMEWETLIAATREALAHISQNAPETDIPPGRVAQGDMTPTEHAALVRVALAAEALRQSFMAAGSDKKAQRKWFEEVSVGLWNDLVTALLALNTCQARAGKDGGGSDGSGADRTDE